MLSILLCKVHSPPILSSWNGLFFFFQLKIKTAAEFIFISWACNSRSISLKQSALSWSSSTYTASRKQPLTSLLGQKWFPQARYWRAATHGIKSTERGSRPCNSIPFVGKNPPAPRPVLPLASSSAALGLGAPREQL